MNSTKTLLSTLLICIALSNAIGADPNKDSLTIVTAPWAVTVIGEGVILKQIHFEQKELFASNQCLHLIEISPGVDVKFTLTTEPLLTTTGVLAKSLNALAAVNGSFFKFTNEVNTVDYNSVDYLRIKNKRLADNTYTSTGQRQRHQEGAVAILGAELYILKATTEKDWEAYIYSEEVICSGPLLAIDGRREPLRQESFYTTRHPRTVVAKKPDGTVMLFITDGRHAEAEGMSLEEVQQSLLWLGAIDILNFDGGGSSTMYVKGEVDEGIVNHPSDNQKFDHLGSRKVANALCIIL